MRVESAVVEQVGSKPVNTKYGSKPTFSFKAGGQWYRTGFKNLGIAAGDVVTFDFTAGQYGNEVTAVDKGGTAAVAAAPVAAPRPAFSGGGGKGVFPIPALDGQRSIVRQNALTNAREAVVAMVGKAELKDLDAFATRVIDLARKFEAYTTGDMDMAAVKAELEKEQDAS